MGASVVACCDAPPVLELGEEVLDLVALAIKRLVVIEGDFPASAQRNAGLDTLGCERVAKGGAVAAAIGNEGFGERKGIEDKACAPVVAYLAFPDGVSRPASWQKWLSRWGPAPRRTALRNHPRCDVRSVLEPAPRHKRRRNVDDVEATQIAVDRHLSAGNHSYIAEFREPMMDTRNADAPHGAAETSVSLKRQRKTRSPVFRTDPALVHKAGPQRRSRLDVRKSNVAAA